MGDPAGIGPEVIVKGLATAPDYCRPIVIGDAAHLRRAAEKFVPALALNSIQTLQEANFENGALNVLDLANVSEQLTLGQASAEGGRASVAYIKKAVDLALGHAVHAITTAPISKEGLHLAGHRYPGHTELLADLTGTAEVALMLAGDNLRVVLVTTHVALAEVKNLITRDRVARIIRLTHRWLTQVGLEHPTIAVTGLNPHCGEGGIFGDEEQSAILPAVELTREAGIAVSGPFPADALFGRIRSQPYDAVVAMYHDQGMIPVKMAAMDRGVNITLGLPIIRTSVDHGTAYDIVGQGVASVDSLLAALQMASTLTQSSLVSQ